MPKVKRAGKAQRVREAYAMLAALAAEGACAMAAGSAAGSHQVFAVRSEGSTSAQPVVEVSQAVVAYALRVGWVTLDESGTGLRISDAGRRALRTPPRTKEADARTGAAHAKKTVVRPRAKTALAWLRTRKDKDGGPLITEVQFSAGEKLAADFWYAQMAPRITASWSAVAPGRRMRRAAPGFGVDMRDSVLAARRRFQRALDAVGPELAGILVDVCCHDLGLETAGQAAGWPQRAAKVVLDLALTRLARHYGLLPPERPTGRLRHWGDADYRPSLDAWR